MMGHEPLISKMVDRFNGSADRSLEQLYLDDEIEILNAEPVAPMSAAEVQSHFNQAPDPQLSGLLDDGDEPKYVSPEEKQAEAKAYFTEAVMFLDAKDAVKHGDKFFEGWDQVDHSVPLVREIPPIRITRSSAPAPDPLAEALARIAALEEELCLKNLEST